jgi:hypothetical protein
MVAARERAMASGKPERTDLYGHPGPEPAPRIDVVVPLKRSRSSRRRRSGARRDKLQPQRPIVLVVEDDAFAAKLIVKALEKQSFDVAHASNAPGALPCCGASSPWPSSWTSICREWTESP